jgi:hypothetical protein
VELTGGGFYLGRFNKRGLQESIHCPITLLLDQQRELPSLTLKPDVASHVWPCKKKKDRHTIRRGECPRMVMNGSVALGAKVAREIWDDFLE